MPKRLSLRRFRRGEKRMLEVKLNDRKLPVWMAQRYRIIAAVRQGQSVLAAARHVGCAKETAYRWIREFNRSGFKGFDRISNPAGRPSQLTPRQIQLLLQVARKRPTDVGLPFTNWSMTKLQDYLVKHRRFPPVSPEWLRRLLRRSQVSWQRTKTWKQSSDPDFELKKSGFWPSMPIALDMGRWSATTNWGPWNSGPYPECVGPIMASRNGIARPTRASRVLSSCTGSMTFMPIVWLGVSANARRLKTSSLALPSYGDVIRRRFGSTL